MPGTFVGGLRARLIKDSCFYVVKNGLADLGWFAGGRRHAPITLVGEQQDLTTEIPVNTLALFAEGRGATTDWELGSNLAQHRRGYYCDFFAESDALGEHVIEDVRDLLEGRMPDLGRSEPSVMVLDYTQATPVPVFYVQVEDMKSDRAHNFPQPFLRHWFSLQFSLTDFYGDDLDGQSVIVVPPGVTPQPAPGPEPVPTWPLSPNVPADEAMVVHAGTDVVALRAVVPLFDGTVGYADNTSSGQIGRPVWLTLGAASAGGTVEVLTDGEISELAWNWVPGPVFLGTHGQLTQSVPTASGGAVFLLQLGQAASPTTLQFDPQYPIVLA